uniref:DDE Tnp4 domain-containing protein n=1 Tax=Chenopodium quinoa TaxID=63459 RepID=A0A803MTN5_CHEQI
MESNNVQKSQMIRKRMIIGVVTAIIASVLAFLNVKKSRTKRPIIVRQPYVNRDSLREANIDSVLYCGDSHCLGQICMRPSAIDGTHVRASVPIEMQERFRGRKDKTTQNVLAAVDFDLKFTYGLASWEGSAHDSRVLGDALRKGFKVPEGKYYLADAGYGDRKGFMPPFRRVRYHLKEYTDNPPENEQELFNLRHSSLRMCIERAFGVLKKRFRILDAEPFWSYETQVDVVLACCVIHNYLRGVDPNDAITREADLEVETHEIMKSLT